MNDLNKYKIYALSNRAAVIDLGNIISEPLNGKVLAMERWMRSHAFAGLLDLAAAYSSLTVWYDPSTLYQQCPAGKTVFDVVKDHLEEAWAESSTAVAEQSRRISIPVCYDPALGPDLEEMSASKNISIDEIIHVHCSIDYRVYMLGFLPGFAYMGKVDERLVMSRRSQPREVQAGAVGIAGWQTGIYPLASPGGWQIIGRTPLKLFDAANDPTVLLAAGDIIRFYPVSLEEFKSLSQ